MRVYLSSEQAVTPSALEIMQGAKEQSGVIEELEFSLLAASDAELPPNATVLSLGSYKRVGDERVVIAPSVAAIMTKADIVTRLGTAFRLLVDPPELPEFEYTVIDDLEGAIEFLTDTVDLPKVVVDIETSGDISVDEATPERIISVSITAGGMAYVFTEELCAEQLFYHAFCRFLAANGIIAVNGKFDLKYFPDSLVKFLRDTQLAHYALFPAAGQHDLKNTTKKYFGFEDWDAATKEFTGKATYEEAWRDEETGAWADARSYSSGSGYERIPRELLYRYNAFDVYATWHWDVLMEEYLADDEDSRKVLALLMKLSDMFMAVEKRGIRLDIPYLEELSKVLTAEKIEALAKLNEIAEKPINPNSHVQVGNWLKDHGLHLKNTSEPILTEFKENEEGESQELDFVNQLLVCRDYTKQLGTYVDGYRKQADAKGIVRPGYKLTASTTGRLGGQGASMLTLPRDKRLKKMVLAFQDNHRVVGADLSQAELRVMACESMDEWLIAAFQPGAADFFDLLLTEAYPKRDWFELHRRVSAHETTEAESDLYNNARARMKGVVYGVSFGRGVPAIARALKIPIYESQQLVNAFVRPGSMFAMWREDITNRAVEGEAIVTKFGRHFQSELITRKNKQNVINSALSFTSQSTANDICLTAALAVDAQLPAYGAHLMGTIHDAIYTSTPTEEVDLVGELLVRELKKAGEAVYGDLIPFTADWGYGKTLADV
ncbi:DNA polymerase [uncultured Arthrobacter sp.]|uniref:DNA polymerase n=1 Tax=uncultured Arthrobacter sp. TaxID=114050 RepID=UPI0032169C41